jgi:hypothetical protein
MAYTVQTRCLAHPLQGAPSIGALKERQTDPYRKLSSRPQHSVLDVADAQLLPRTLLLWFGPRWLIHRCCSSTAFPPWHGYPHDVAVPPQPHVPGKRACWRCINPNIQARTPHLALNLLDFCCADGTAPLSKITSFPIRDVSPLPAHA